MNRTILAICLVHLAEAGIQAMKDTEEVAENMSPGKITRESIRSRQGRIDKQPTISVNAYRAIDGRVCARTCGGTLCMGMRQRPILMLSVQFWGMC
ncbi:MAG: hypothetical protein CV089_00330 [Nitrospira sp. WS110]|nr:hypothetical protein [Nitrospira sp. WS110]